MVTIDGNTLYIKFAPLFFIASVDKNISVDPLVITLFIKQLDIVLVVIFSVCFVGANHQHIVKKSRSADIAISMDCAM